MDYWRGFTGGLIAGVAIGAWVYFSPRVVRQHNDFERFNEEGPDGLSLHRESPESAGDPAKLLPETMASAG